MLVSIQSYLLYIGVRFDELDYLGPGAGGGVHAFRVWNDFVGHLTIITKRTRLVSAAIAIHCAFFAAHKD